MSGIKSLLVVVVLFGTALAAPTKDQDSYSDSSGSGNSNGGYSYDSANSDSGSYDSNSYDLGNDSSWSSSANQWAASSTWSSPPYTTTSVQWTSTAAAYGSAETSSAWKYTSTSSTASSYYTPSYGSGSTGWSDLNSCMQVCQSQFGGMSSSASSYNATATATSSSAAATHTIIVAPTQGVLRFVPFAVTADEGDALEFVWGAGPHTATLSDSQNVCNSSTAADAFNSGKLNATATFQGKVLSSSPQFHYCTVTGHCAKGMFGIINPPSTNISNNLTAAATSSTSTVPIASSTAGNGKGKSACSDNSVDCWVSSWSSSSPQASATVAAVKSACGSTGAWNWGGKWDMSGITSEVVTKEIIVENIMYSRLMMAMNPSMLNSTGPVSTDFVAPPDLNAFVAAADTSASAVSSAVPQTVTANSITAPAGSAAEAAAGSTASAKSGAGRVAAVPATFIGSIGVLVAMLI